MTKKIDWAVEQDLTDYSFQPKNIIIRYYPRIRIWLSAFLGRKAFTKDFAIKNGIRKNDNPENVLLPKFYCVDHKCNDRIAKIRDSIIIDKYNLYKKTQLSLIQVVKQVEQDLSTTESNLKTESDILKDQIKKLAEAERTKDSLNIISYQSAIEAQKTLLAQNKLRFDTMKENYNLLKAQGDKNKEQWLKQVDFINSAIRNLTRSFEHTITKTVKKKYNFGHFETHIKDYALPTKQILNGDKC